MFHDSWDLGIKSLLFLLLYNSTLFIPPENHCHSMFKRLHLFCHFLRNCTWGPIFGHFTLDFDFGGLSPIYSYALQNRSSKVCFISDSGPHPHCIQLCPIAIVHPESGSSQPFTPLLSPTILNALLLLQIFCFMFETCHRALCYSSYLVEFYFTQN